MLDTPHARTEASAARTETFDVVVIGGGGSGLAAAISARSAGRQVVLLEKNPQLGGTTVWSVGSIAAANTPYQIRHGILDSPREHFEDLGRHNAKFADRDNLALRKLLTENVTESVRLLMEAGVEFLGPLPDPPSQRDRMINILPNSKAYAYHLGKHARRLGVDIRTGMRAETLLKEGERIAGVRCRADDGSLIDFRARGGVVLAAGDYAGGLEMKRRFQSELIANIPPVNASATGDGQLLGLEAGGRIINGDLFNSGIRFVPPKQKSLVQKIPPWTLLMRLARFGLEHLPGWIIRPLLMRTLTSVLVPSAKLFQEGAILVNSAGAHIEATHEEMTVAVASQPDNTAYILFDGAIASKFHAWPYDISTAPGIAYAYLDDYRRNRPDICREAPTLEALAADIGLPAAALVQSVRSYNDKAPSADG